MGKKSNSSLGCNPIIFTIPFWIFIYIKVAGTSLASWSWFWIFIPIIPILAFIFDKLNWSI